MSLKSKLPKLTLDVLLKFAEEHSKDKFDINHSKT